MGTFSIRHTFYSETPISFGTLLESNNLENKIMIRHHHHTNILFTILIPSLRNTRNTNTHEYGSTCGANLFDTKPIGTQLVPHRKSTSVQQFKRSTFLLWNNEETCLVFLMSNVGGALLLFTRWTNVHQL